MTASPPGSPGDRAASLVRRAGTTLSALRKRLGPRGTIAALGGTALVVVIAGLALLGGPGGKSGASPAPTAAAAASASPAPSPAPAGDVLPTPGTTDAVLLVGSPASLTAAEERWLADLRTNLGRVDALAYGDASLERLRAYFVVFVVDQSPDLDVGALADAYHAGMTVHLVGPAAGYRDQVAAAAVRQ
jgi:hypothetical protein